MTPFVPSRRHHRVTVRLRGVLTAAGRAFPVTVVSLSEAGFYCEGADLDLVASPVRVAVRLESGEPAWRPRDPDSPWGGDGGNGQPPVFECLAETLYLDLHRSDDTGSATVGLGARIAELDERRGEVLREFVSRELFRTRQWRTRGGSVPLPGDDVGQPHARHR